jgi:hypothetical protein
MLVCPRMGSRLRHLSFLGKKNYRGTEESNHAYIVCVASILRGTCVENQRTYNPAYPVLPAKDGMRDVGQAHTHMMEAADPVVDTYLL